MSYGVQPTGFVRKPLAVILAEIEAALITEFGPELIQTAQTPMGQINGTFSGAGSQFAELTEDVYHANDPDQAEGRNLDRLGRIRLLQRGALTDSAFRRLITNQGNARIDISDIVSAIRGIDGVTFAYVWTNETGEIVRQELESATIAIAVIGGDDEEIADAIRQYIVPGISTYGNYQIISESTGYCRSFNVIRPIDVPVTINVNVRISKDKEGCPAPNVTAIRDALVASWPDYRLNGRDVTRYHVRYLIEGTFSQVEVLSIDASRDSQPAIGYTSIGFIEIASLSASTTTVTVIDDEGLPI